MCVIFFVVNLPGGSLKMFGDTALCAVIRKNISAYLTGNRRAFSNASGLYLCNMTYFVFYTGVGLKFLCKKLTE